MKNEPRAAEAINAAPGTERRAPRKTEVGPRRAVPLLFSRISERGTRIGKSRGHAGPPLLLFILISFFILLSPALQAAESKGQSAPKGASDKSRAVAAPGPTAGYGAVQDFLNPDGRPHSPPMGEYGAAGTKDKSRAAPKKDTIVLKMMIVNPSEKFDQKYSLKAYLPEEVQPEYIVGKDDLELGYDAEKKAYYVAKDIKLDPGETMVKAIEIKDVWQVSMKEMENYSGEAKDIFAKLQGTEYEPKARLLLSNVEVLLTQVYERQKDDTATPEQHISIYRDNRIKMRDVEMDIVTLRRLLANKREGKAGSSGPSLPVPWDNLGHGDGEIPAWVAWRVIFGILGLLAFLSVGFYVTWLKQVRSTQESRKENKDNEAINLDELFDMKGPDSGLAAKVKPPGSMPKDSHGDREENAA